MAAERFRVNVLLISGKLACGSILRKLLAFDGHFRRRAIAQLRATPILYAFSYKNGGAYRHTPNASEILKDSLIIAATSPLGLAHGLFKLTNRSKRLAAPDAAVIETILKPGKEQG